ncbi:hypothetical protein ACFS32_23790 [Novosphingobium pokkalii]|uniref:hypothetical protein n=1 Tax=Novosphingobium pokkalii TaxID=1770194 RepID=UPI0036315F9D
MRDVNPSRRALLGGLAALSAATTMASQRASAGPTAIHYGGPSIPLWPGAAPGAPKVLPTRRIEQRSQSADFDDRWLYGVAAPTLEVRRPAFQDGSAVILVPGGGYGFLSIDNEGEEQANWLTRRGVTCFILYYRLPDEGWANRGLVPLQDAQRAIRLVRHRAGNSASIRRGWRCSAFPPGASGRQPGDTLCRKDLCPGGRGRRTFGAAGPHRADLSGHHAERELRPRRIARQPAGQGRQPGRRAGGFGRAAGERPDPARVPHGRV